MQQGKEKFSATVKEKLTDATEEQKAEVIKILVHHFDPSLKPIKFEKKPRRGWTKRITEKKIETTANTTTNTANVAAAVIVDPPTPDTTTTTSSPSKSNGVVTPQEVSPTHNSTPAPTVSTTPAKN